MSPPDPATVTRLLHALSDGDTDALNALFPLVYETLRAQAQQQRRRWQGQMTLNTTALVHEAYLKLTDQTHASWQNRAHFCGVAAKAMRHILIDYARRSRRKKRGGDRQKVSLEMAQEALAIHDVLDLEDRADTLLVLDEALSRLGRINERQARVVECRFFAGMTIDDTAEALAISPSTVKRDWMLAQAWLYREIKQALDA